MYASRGSFWAGSDYACGDDALSQSTTRPNETTSQRERLGECLNQLWEEFYVQVEEACIADRERIATDLCHHVIQRIFGAGLDLHAAVALDGQTNTKERILEVVDSLDDTIRDIRNSVFCLSRPRDGEQQSPPSDAASSERTVLARDDEQEHWVRVSGSVANEQLSIDIKGSVILLVGEIDVATAPKLSAALSGAARAGTELVIDFAGVSFMDASGLSVLFDAKQYLHRVGGEITVRSPPGKILKLFEITDLTKAFLIIDAER